MQGPQPYGEARGRDGAVVTAIEPFMESGATMRVLVFDDEAAIGRLVVRVATLAGMEAMAVADAEAFEQQLRSQPPQLIVLDLQLGDTDGVTQLRRLAEQHYTGSLVLMSGFDARVLATARMLGETLGLKLAGVLEKPLQVAELQKLFEQLDAASRPLSAQRLLEAIVEDEMSLDFQPIVTRKPKELKKLEALVRWEHPVDGRIPPDRFLPMAEGDTITIDALTDWVVGAAVEAYQVLAELGVSVPLSVNLSTQNLHDLSLPDRIGERLRAGGMPARHLCLEITESAAFKDVALTMDILSRIRLKGMSLSIDDFGTGYSSLKLLRQMPFSELKIDQSFVSDLTISRDSRAIVKSIVDLAGNMGMGCVAEGVETEETAELLEQMGVCDLQGFLIAQPMPVEAVAAWLAIWLHSGPGTSEGQAGSPAHAPAGERAAARMPGGTTSPAVQLSPRQTEVMQVLSEGCSVKEIARRLNISVSTVKVHLAQAYSAFGARNRIEAVMRFGGAKVVA
jgi:EAL domain-containing protein (putative c-di-GMP-specific phosphodiesterase class I)/FixJ family two-component response regulator